MNSFLLPTYFPALGIKMVSPYQELTAGLMYKLTEKKDLQCKTIFDLYSFIRGVDKVDHYFS